MSEGAYDKQKRRVSQFHGGAEGRKYHYFIAYAQLKFELNITVHIHALI